KALALDVRDELPAALDTLKHALTLAEPEGYTRIFLDEGTPLVGLLSQVEEADPSLLGYVQTLLAHQKVAPGQIPASSLDNDRCRQQPLVEPLSERELEVLQLMAAGTPNEEI